MMHVILDFLSLDLVQPLNPVQSISRAHPTGSGPTPNLDSPVVFPYPALPNILARTPLISPLPKAHYPASRGGRAWQGSIVQLVGAGIAHRLHGQDVLHAGLDLSKTFCISNHTSDRVVRSLSMDYPFIRDREHNMLRGSFSCSC